MVVFQSLVIGLLTSLAVYYALFLWRRRRLYYLASKFEGPRGLPLIGIAHKLLTSDFTKMFNFIMSVSKGHEAPAAGWIGPEFVIFADTPESLQVVLNSQNCLDKSFLYDVLVLTKGLIVGGGELWRRHRKILNPSFSISVLQKLIPLFDEKSKVFVKNLENEVGKKEFDVYSYMSACSLETLLKGTMEIDRDVQSNPLQNEYVHNIEICAGIFMRKMCNLLYRIKPFYRLTNLYKLEQKHAYDPAHKGVFTIADEVYDENIKIKGRDNMEEDDENMVVRKPKNFISTLLDPKNALTEEEIKHEINTLIAAGHETSAFVISCTLLMLAIHPECQKKVVAELEEVFGSKDATIDYNSLNKLVYLDMVIKETMRIFPVLPVSARKATDEFQIGDKTVPTGATIIVAAFSVHRDKRFWGEDADQFKPERFEPENFKKVPPYAYIPFTGGPRLCIGWRYGMLFMKTTLTNFFRNYEASTHLKFEDLEYEITISMKIVQRCMIKVTKRNSHRDKVMKC